MKVPEKKNQRTFRNLQSHLPYRHSEVVYKSDTQSVKVWWEYNVSDMKGCLLCMKIHRKPRNVNKQRIIKNK